MRVHRGRNGGAAILLVAGALGILSGCVRKSLPVREVWAEVDGEPIFREEVERIYRSRVKSASEAGSPEQALSFKMNILSELINRQILLAHASRSRVAVSEAEVDTKIDALRSPYSKDEFLKKMKEEGMEMGDLRREVRQGMIISILINNEIVSNIEVTDSEISGYYARNKANFNLTETQYHLAQIEVTPGEEPEVRNLKGNDAQTGVTAERKIQALAARLRGGEDFAKVAQEYSEDPKTAASGGDMGFIPASSLNANPPLRQAVTSLQVGRTSGIIRTPGGYHIVKLLGREDAGQRQLSEPEVQNGIRETLRNEKEELLKAAYIEVLRNRTKVVNNLAEQIVNAKAPSGPK